MWSVVEVLNDELYDLIQIQNVDVCLRAIDFDVSSIIITDRHDCMQGWHVGWYVWDIIDHAVVQSVCVFCEIDSHVEFTVDRQRRGMYKWRNECVVIIALDERISWCKVSTFLVIINGRFNIYTRSA